MTIFLDIVAAISWLMGLVTLASSPVTGAVVILNGTVAFCASCVVQELRSNQNNRMKEKNDDLQRKLESAKSEIVRCPKCGQTSRASDVKKSGQCSACETALVLQV